MMDAATAWGLGLTILGTVASIWGAIVSNQQAKEAKQSASEATRAKSQIVNQRRTSDLAELKVHCERAQKAMEKYGPGASSSSLNGVNPENDAAEVRNLLLEANKLSASFQRGEIEIFVNKMTPLLEQFVTEKMKPRLQPNGKAVLMEVSNFLSVVKSNHDAKRESTSVEG